MTLLRPEPLQNVQARGAPKFARAQGEPYYVRHPATAMNSATPAERGKTSAFSWNFLVNCEIGHDCTPNEVFPIGNIGSPGATTGLVRSHKTTDMEDGMDSEDVRFVD